MLALDVTHETRYAYGARVDLAQHLAHLRPRDLPGQRVEDVRIDIEPTPSHWTRGTDVFGNARDAFALYVPHDALRVVATSRVVLATPAGAAPSAPGTQDAPALSGVDTQAWDEVAKACRYRAGAPFLKASEFAFASPFVPQLEGLREYAAPSMQPGRPLLQAVAELMRRIHDGFAYDGNATEVHTPLAEVLKQRRGVCQDFAHVMIGALRAFGLPARYVSGYLLTQPPPGQPRLLGADASHAWVSAWCPPLGWVDFDPTNAVLPGEAGAHVTLALGRDYGDVMPLRGVIRGGGGEHALSVAVSVVPRPAAAGVTTGV
jgi:transglutaminase-like putative cysteine protease